MPALRRPARFGWCSPPSASSPRTASTVCRSARSRPRRDPATTPRSTTTSAPSTDSSPRSSATACRRSSARRRLLAARCDPDDLRSRFEAHFLPVLSMAEATDNHYVSFVEQIQRMDLAAAGDLLDLPAEGRRSNEEFRRDLHRLLDAPRRAAPPAAHQRGAGAVHARRRRPGASGRQRRRPGAVRALRQLALRRAGRLPGRPGVARRRCGACATPATSAPDGSACCEERTVSCARQDRELGLPEGGVVTHGASGDVWE